MPVRLKDIAEDLGVSVVTVSKVLRDHPDIGPETRERVLSRAKEMGYQPNLAARALVTGRTLMLGLIVPDIVHPFFGEVAKGITKVLRRKGYNLLIASSEEEPELERQEIDNLLARRVDALILASNQWTVDSFRRIEEHKTPYILVDRRFAGLAAHFVGVDDELVGSMATDHLIANGYRRIAHIRGRETSTATGRLAGYRQALARHGIEARPDYVVVGRSVDDTGESSGKEAMRELLTRSPKPDAVFCYNDPLALGAMRAIAEAGLQVSADIGVAGCGGANYGDLLRVPLTTIDQGSRAIGEKAAQLALRLIASKETIRPVEVLIEPKLVVRESSLGPR